MAESLHVGAETGFEDLSIHELYVATVSHEGKLLKSSSNVHFYLKVVFFV